MVMEHVNVEETTDLKLANGHILTLDVIMCMNTFTIFKTCTCRDMSQFSKHGKRGLTDAWPAYYRKQAARLGFGSSHVC